jgi:hypothetical protein
MPVKHTCQIAHALLLTGPCPWCGAIINNGMLGTLSMDAKVQRRWDLAAIRGSLGGDSALVCLVSITKGPLHGSELQALLPILAEAARHPDSKLRWLTSVELSLQGVHLFSSSGERSYQSGLPRPSAGLLRLKVTPVRIGSRNQAEACVVDHRE